MDAPELLTLAATPHTVTHLLDELERLGMAVASVSYTHLTLPTNREV